MYGKLLGNKSLALNKPGSTNRFTTDMLAGHSSDIFPGCGLPFAPPRARCIGRTQCLWDYAFDNGSAEKSRFKAMLTSDVNIRIVE
jgi:hypothetical protein